jgi:site-specific recombinase XerD
MSQKPTFEELEDFAIHLRSRDRAERTVTGYRRDLEHFAAWFAQTNGCAPAPATVTPLDVREYRQHLLQRYKPASTNRRLAALRAFFAWALERGIVSSNPAQAIRWVRQAPRAPRWLTRSQAYTLLRAVQEARQVAEARGNEPSAHKAIRDRVIICLMLFAGLRISEVCELTPADVVLNERSGKVIVRLGKGEKYREVPLNADARRALREWLVVRPPEGEQLFVGQGGEALGDTGVRNAVGKYARQAGLEKVTPHALRHTFGKNLVDAGVSLDRVADLMGHESLETTRVYTTPSEADLAEAVGRIGFEDD